MKNDVLKVDGKLLGINAVEQVTEKFKKRKFWLETDIDSQWPQTVEFELIQDKVDIIDKFKKGDILSVGFNLRGRKYTNKTTGKDAVFNSLNAWFVDKSKGETTSKSEASSLSAEDDLPF
jgi:hypothetical protein